MITWQRRGNHVASDVIPRQIKRGSQLARRRRLTLSSARSLPPSDVNKISIDVLIEREHGSVESIGSITLTKAKARPVRRRARRISFTGLQADIEVLHDGDSQDGLITPFSFTYERVREAVINYISEDELPPDFMFITRKNDVYGFEIRVPVGTQQEHSKRLSSDQIAVLIRCVSPADLVVSEAAINADEYGCDHALSGEWDAYANDGAVELIYNSEHVMKEDGMLQCLYKDITGANVFSWIVFVVRDRIDGDRRITLIEDPYTDEDLSKSSATFPTLHFLPG